MGPPKAWYQGHCPTYGSTEGLVPRLLSNLWVHGRLKEGTHTRDIPNGRPPRSTRIRIVCFRCARSRCRRCIDLAGCGSSSRDRGNSSSLPLRTATPAMASNSRRCHNRCPHDSSRAHTDCPSRTDRAIRGTHRSGRPDNHCRRHNCRTCRSNPLGRARRCNGHSRQRRCTRCRWCMPIGMGLPGSSRCSSPPARLVCTAHRFVDGCRACVMSPSYLTSRSCPRCGRRHKCSHPVRRCLFPPNQRRSDRRCCCSIPSAHRCPRRHQP
jgi:hypothetical protein